MTRHEEFADPVIVPGPNVRSLFTETEDVEGHVAEQVDADDARFCPACHRVYPGSALVCVDDGTELVELPPQAEDA